jgi:Domain of unknown function (DUF4112)
MSFTCARAWEQRTALERVPGITRSTANRNGPEIDRALACYHQRRLEARSSDGRRIRFSRHHHPLRSRWHIIGLIPVAGDVLAGLVLTYLIWEAQQLGGPKLADCADAGEHLLDTTIGAIPVVGDACCHHSGAFQAMHSGVLEAYATEQALAAAGRYGVRVL